MVLRNIIVHIILPIIMLFIGFLGVISPETVNKSKWISKPFEFKILNKNEKTIKTATITNCICLLVEGIMFSILSIMVLGKKINFSSFETFLLVICTVIIPLPFIFIVHVVKFDRNGNLRKK